MNSSSSIDSKPAIPTDRKATGKWFQSKSLNVMVRWLHLYLSMFGFLTILFFSFTGITLNHPTWFGGEKNWTKSTQGSIDATWLTPSLSEDKIDRLKIAEEIREQQHLRGKVSEFRIEDEACWLTFKGPGYSADIELQRHSGKYDATIVEYGWVGKWNDLHKGRDSGFAWSVLIDASAIVMILSSLSGLGMLFFMKKKRSTGLIVTGVGALVFAIFYWMLVP